MTQAYSLHVYISPVSCQLLIMRNLGLQMRTTMKLLALSSLLLLPRLNSNSSAACNHAHCLH